MAQDTGDNEHWANEEKFFSRSWTHGFYFWKLRQVILGRTVARLLARNEPKKRLRVVDLGCGPGTNIFGNYSAPLTLAIIQME